MVKSLLDKMRDDRADMVKRSPAQRDRKAGPEDRFVKAIDLHLGKRGEPKFKKKKGFSPSSTIDCARRDIYFFRGGEMVEQVDARTQRIFDNGNDVHERLYGYFEEMGVLVEKEWWTEWPDPPIRAYLDGVIMWEGELGVLELKSIGDDGFEWRKKMARPKDDHVQQVQIYMEIRDMEWAFVVYENKNTQEILTFRVDRDREFVAKLFKKWRKTWELFNKGILPDRPVKSPESKKCTYCEWKNVCWEGWKA